MRPRCAAARGSSITSAGVVRLGRPNALAIDCLLLAAAIAAEHARIPTALLMHTVYFLPAPGAPPYGLGLRPARHALDRFTQAVTRRLGQAWFDRLGLARINALRNELGLRPLEHVVEQALRASRVLVLTAPGFDFASRAQLPCRSRSPLECATRASHGQGTRRARALRGIVLLVNSRLSCLRPSMTDADAG